MIRMLNIRRPVRPVLRSATLMAAGALALFAAGCAQVDKVAFLATTGEAPGQRTRYVDIGGPDRLGKNPPRLSGRRYAPQPVPGAGKADESAAAARISEPVTALTAQYARIRQTLVDMDDGYQLRRASLYGFARTYVAISQKITLRPGDPLPENQTEIKKTIAEMRQAIGAMRGDLLKMHNLLVRLDGTGLTAIALSRQVAATRPAAPGDAKRLADLKAALDKSIVSARALAVDGRKEVGAYVEYLTGQESSIAKLEDQLKNAKPLAAN